MVPVVFNSCRGGGDLVQGGGEGLLVGAGSPADDGGGGLWRGAGGEEFLGEGGQGFDAHVEDEGAAGGEEVGEGGVVDALGIVGRVFFFVGGDEGDGGGEVAVGDGDAGVGGGSDAGSDAGDDREGDLVFVEVFGFFAAAAEDVGVAAFETDDGQEL